MQDDTQALKRTRFGQFLVEFGLLTPSQLERSLKVHRQAPATRIGEVCVQLGFLTEDDLRRALSRFSNQEEIDLDSLEIDETFLTTETARNPQVIRLVSPDMSESVLLTSSSESAVEILARKYTNQCGQESKVVVRDEEGIFSLFVAKAKLYIEKKFYESAQTLIAGGSPGPFLEALLSYAIVERASDIHFDVEPGYCRIRFRTEGMLRPIFIIKTTDYQMLLNYMKDLAKIPGNVNVRKPIDGSFSFSKGLLNADIRLSIVPSAKSSEVGVGSTVLRLFMKGSKEYSLSQLGFHSSQISLIREWFRSSSGLIIMSGPTGSGKSTTVRAALTEIINPSTNIMSVEDPVERLMPIMKQVQVEEGQLSFEEVLVAMLRHDPDIIFVGEIRNAEVAKISLHAALTGHLVIATLHALNAVSVVSRLLELGIESQLLLNTLKGIISQRLVRKNCPHCSEKAQVDRAYQRWAERAEIQDEMKGAGCEKCFYEGFLGRTIIAETYPVMEVDPSLLLDPKKYFEAQDALKSLDQFSLFEHGVFKVREGLTTLEEVVRVV